MANLDVGTGSDPSDDSTGGGGPGGPPTIPRPPMQPPGIMQRQRPSMPGAGNIGDALQKVGQAADLLRQAIASFPHGSKEGGEVNRAIGILNRIGPSQGAMQQVNVTSARDALRQAMQNAVAGRAQQIQGANPQQQPITAAPGV